MKRSAAFASRRSHLAQAGVTLLEALVALLIMAFGMVALIGMQGNMRRSADFAKQLSEAVRLAQRETETLRAYSMLSRDADTPAQTLSFDQIVNAQSADAGDAVRNAVYSVRRNVVNAPDGINKIVAVQVGWTDRAGVAQTLLLRSFVARVDPRLSAALTVPADGEPTRRPLDRAVAIPFDAKDLGDGRSVFKPPNSGGVAWIFNNLSGKITSRCTGFGANVDTASITAADVASRCDNNVTAYLLSGHVRFSTGPTPDPEAPSSTALPLEMAVDVTPADAHPTPAYQCFDDAPPSAVNTQTEGVRYYCAVYPNSATPPNWTGVLRIADISLGAGGYKVCRYSADYNGDGRTANDEHPQQYTNVSRALVGQNFLVIAASNTCPVGRSFEPSAGVFFNSATVQHQP
ncbi:MAG: hypothetical protein C0423_06830 [Methylibium sp.]|nr:hypothetical protein [Methylibium sp.]